MSRVSTHTGVIDDLTNEQRLAAATSRATLFIEAGPGTGKTTVSAQRFGVQRFTAAHRHDARAVVAVSFTRGATHILRQRVQRLWGPSALTWPHRIVTLDSIMCDLLYDLMRQGLVIWPKSSTLWPDGNIVLDVRDSWASAGGTVWTKSDYEANLSGRQIHFRKIFHEKQGARFPTSTVMPLLQQGVCTHQDVRGILTLALRDPISAERVRRRIGETMRAIIVDEAFDANELDITIIETAINAGVNVTLVGDPWQALYLFRGARPDAISGLIIRAEVGKLKLTNSFRWQSSEQHDLAIRARAGCGIVLPSDQVEIDVALATEWADLWDLRGEVLPLAFHSFKGGYEEAAATLLLNHVTRSIFDLDATYLNDALIALNVSDRDVPRKLEPQLQRVVDVLCSGGRDGVKAAYLLLVEVVSGVSSRELRPPHHAHTNRLARLQGPLSLPGRPVPGLTVHQAKGCEWDVVGLRLKPEERAVLAGGLDSAKDLHRKIYVACTRARERTVEIVLEPTPIS